MEAGQRLAITGLVMMVTAAMPDGNIASAADNCSGYYVNTGTASISLDTTRRADDARAIAIGTCDADGRCFRTDKDGDQYTAVHEYVPGEERATWKIVAGTGKYARAKSAGWYKQVRADGETVVGTWAGTCD